MKFINEDFFPSLFGKSKPVATQKKKPTPVTQQGGPKPSMSTNNNGQSRKPTSSNPNMYTSTPVAGKKNDQVDPRRPIRNTQENEMITAMKESREHTPSSDFKPSGRKRTEPVSDIQENDKFDLGVITETEDELTSKELIVSSDNKAQLSREKRYQIPTEQEMEQFLSHSGEMGRVLTSIGEDLPVTEKQRKNCLFFSSLLYLLSICT